MIQKTTLLRITKFTFCFLLISLLFPIYSFKAISQSNTNTYEEIIPFEQTEEIPVFKGCDINSSRKDAIECFNQKMSNHIRRNFRYPEEAAEKKIQGQVQVSFIINDSGLIKDIVAVVSNKQDKSGILEEEATRIVRLLPKFSPGKHKGQVVSVKYEVPITFKLM